MGITEEMHIDCPPATAFDLMADVRQLTEWNEGASRAEMTSAGPIGQGSRFVAVNRGQEMESTITRFDRPERLDFSVTGKTMAVAAVFRFTEAGAAGRSGDDVGTVCVVEPVEVAVPLGVRQVVPRDRDASPPCLRFATPSGYGTPAPTVAAE